MRNLLTNILFEMYNPNCSMEDLMFENGGWIIVKYKCHKCGAEDTDTRLADDHTPLPPALNCWSCGAGRGLEVPQMLQTKKGMFPMSIPSVVTSANPGRIAVVERHPN